MIGIELFKEKCDKLGLTILEEDLSNKSTRDKIKLRDNEGYLYYLDSGNISVILRRNSNPQRYLRGNVFTIENIKTYLLLNNKNLELLTKDIKSAKQKLDFKCTICGHKFKRCWNSIQSECDSCEICTNKVVSYTHDMVKKYIEEDSNSGCKLISNKYINYHEKLLFKCSCGELFYRTFSEFKSCKLYRCFKCTTGREKQYFTYEDVKQDLLNNNIKLLSTEYKNNITKIEVEYACGFKCCRSYENIRKSEYKCPHCNKVGYGRDTEQLRREIKTITNGEYELLSEYQTMNHKVEIKHLKCGNVYAVTPHSFLDSGNRCPRCNCSKGEQLISNILNENNISNVWQYEFEDCINPNTGITLKFDFAVFNQGELQFLIEYDGEFHYHKIHEEHDFEGQVYRDSLKNEYCKSKNIKLIRIPYWEFDNIEKILKEENVI